MNKNFNFFAEAYLNNIICESLMADLPTSVEGAIDIIKDINKNAKDLFRGTEKGLTFGQKPTYEILFPADAEICYIKNDKIKAKLNPGIKAKKYDLDEKGNVKEDTLIEFYLPLNPNQVKKFQTNALNIDANWQKMSDEEIEKAKKELEDEEKKTEYEISKDIDPNKTITVGDQIKKEEAPVKIESLKDLWEMLNRETNENFKAFKEKYKANGGTFKIPGVIFKNLFGKGW